MIKLAELVKVLDTVIIFTVLNTQNIMELFSPVTGCSLNVQLWMFSDSKSTFLTREKPNPSLQMSGCPGEPQLISTGANTGA